MASGRPVIAFGVGGACETVVNNVTGVFFEDQSWEALADTVVRFRPEIFDPQKIKAYAEQFNTENFKTQITNLVAEKWAEREKSRIVCRSWLI